MRNNLTKPTLDSLIFLRKAYQGYVEILGDNQMVVTDFFRELTYKTEQNKEMLRNQFR